MSEMINKNKYLDFGGLSKYDALIKNFIATGNSELAAAIAALDAKIGNIDVEGSDDKTLAEIIEGIYASIAEIVEKQDSLDAKDVELEGKINDIVGDLESLEEGVSEMTLVEVANKLKAIEGSVSKNAQDIVGVTERVSALEETIKELGEIEGGENLGSVVNKVNANVEAIATLKGEGEGSVKKTAADAASAAASSALDDAKAYTDSKVDGKFDEAGAAAQALADAKAYTDSKVDGKFDEAGAAAAAQAAAIADAESKYQLKGDYEAAGAAAQALADAKADAAELYQVKGDYEAAGTAAALNEAMDERVKALEEIDHDKIAADAVAAVVAGAESDFDTLKEVADWIASDKEGSAALQVSVSKNTEDITKLDAKVDADIKNLADHMTEASVALGEVDERLGVLESFVETHESISESDIEGLFA
jgi:hypothetical protein